MDLEAGPKSCRLDENVDTPTKNTTKYSYTSIFLSTNTQYLLKFKPIHVSLPIDSVV